jgi:hypothetical protein
LAHVSAAERKGTIERNMLRPLVRGETLRAWQVENRLEHLIWPHGSTGETMAKLPPLAEAWLRPHRAQLSARTDLRGGRWWSLFRIESAQSHRPRVIWADFGLSPRAMAVDAGDPLVAINTCYVVSCEDMSDAHALTALLNGPLISAWLNILAEPARGGYRRYMGWTLALLPLPRRWNKSRDELGCLGASVGLGSPPSSAALLEASLHAYGLSLDDVDPLISWRGPSD